MLRLQNFYKKRFKNKYFIQDTSEKYNPGMDVSHIDHITTAKRGELFEKKFIECRGNDIVLVIDVSSSHLFGSIMSKIDFAKKLSSKICYMANETGDDVGILLFSSKINFYSAPYKKIKNIEIPSNMDIGTSSDINAVINSLKVILKKPSVIFFMSDFLYPDKIRPAIISGFKSLSRRHDLICVQLIDNADFSMPKLGKICVQDAETKQATFCNTNNSEFRKIYSNIFSNWCSKLKKDMLGAKIKFVQLMTNDDLDEAFMMCLDKHLAYK